MSYRIPERNLPRLEAAIAKLNRRAAKLGVPPVAISTTGREEEVWYTTNPELGRMPQERVERLGLQTEGLRRVVLAFLTVTVSGETPKLAGWTFLATLDHTAETGIILRTVPGETVPEAYRTAEAACDHCRLARRRHQTFVLRHDDGTHKRVGRQCLVDFLGGQTPENIAERAAWFGLIGDALRGAEEWDGADGFGWGEGRWPVEDVLAIASAAIAKHGWTSRKAAAERGGYATADRLVSIFTARVPLSDDDRVDVTAADVELAARTVEWAHGLGLRATLSDYEHNVHVLLTGTSLRVKDFGVAASAVAAYQREVGQAAQREHERATSAYFGEVGKRAEYTLTIVNRVDIPGDWGTTRLYIMVDPAGNRAKTFASRLLWKELPGGGTEGAELGDTWRVKATVKAHEEYKGVAYTNLSRVTLLERLPQEDRG